MGQVRHGIATTTHAVRAATQRSQASLSTLSRELGINPKTVAKWRKRATIEDLKTGPKAPHFHHALHSLARLLSVQRPSQHDRSAQATKPDRSQGEIVLALCRHCCRP
jgi:transposase-like protein